MAKIELNNIRKMYGAFEAVKRLDLTVEDGEFVVLVGPSGCGKTTTLRMIAGFEDPTEGEVVMNGQVVNDLEPGDRNIGMVFQSHALFPHKTVYNNIEFGLRMKKIEKSQRHKMIMEVAEMVRITHLLDNLPGQCSGGESQRVALARTLVTEPSTFLLDEPLSSLDAKLRRELRAEADRLHSQLQKTFVYVTHDQEEAMTLADRIVVMRAGQIEQVGSPMDIYSNPSTLFVADFFGSPSMNLIDARLGTKSGKTMVQSTLVEVAARKVVKTTDEGIVLGVRPEKVVLKPSRKAGDPKISLVEPLGRDTLIYLQAEGVRPFISVMQGLQVDRYKAGQSVSVSVDPTDVYLFTAEGKRLI